MGAAKSSPATSNPPSFHFHFVSSLVQPTTSPMLVFSLSVGPTPTSLEQIDNNFYDGEDCDCDGDDEGDHDSEHYDDYDDDYEDNYDNNEDNDNDDGDHIYIS